MDKYYFSTNLDEVAYLLVKGAELKEKTKTSPQGRWFLYKLGKVNKQWLTDFNNPKDTSVSVADFLNERNQLKFQLSETRKNDV